MGPRLGLKAHEVPHCHKPQYQKSGYGRRGRVCRRIRVWGRRHFCAQDYTDWRPSESSHRKGGKWDKWLTRCLSLCKPHHSWRMPQECLSLVRKIVKHCHISEYSSQNWCTWYGIRGDLPCYERPRGRNRLYLLHYGPPQKGHSFRRYVLLFGVSRKAV